MKYIELYQKDSIAEIRLNDPEQLNAMHWEMGAEMEETVQEISKNKDIRALILTGNGKAFSAGGNFKFIQERSSKTKKENKEEMMQFYSQFLSIRNLEIPTIAKINGPAIGAGFCLALSCDIRIASETSKMGVNFSKIGLSSGMGTLYFLLQLTTPAIASELTFTGKTISAQEALQKQLINEICPPEILNERVWELAEEIAHNAPIAIKIMKKGIQKLQNSSLQDVFEYESDGQSEIFSTEDFKEGITSIIEKRKPVFRNR